MVMCRMPAPNQEAYALKAASPLHIPAATRSSPLPPLIPAATRLPSLPLLSRRRRAYRSNPSLRMLRTNWITCQRSASVKSAPIAGIAVPAIPWVIHQKMSPSVWSST